MDKSCLECGDSFQGRIDKKFCSDLCRNAYNNKINSSSTIYVRSVNSILRKNRKILEELIPSQNSRASRNKLQQRGFNFSFHTHVQTTQTGSSFFCYEYGYVPVENDHVMLLKRDADEN